MLDLNTVRARFAFPKDAIKYYPHTVLTLFFINICVFWPGMFSFDTIVQWDQVLTGQISNLHPPIMSVWWRWLNTYVMMDRGVLLLFHLIVFWSAIYLIGRQTAKYSHDWAFCLLLLWLSPTLLSMTAVLWKDTGMAFCFLLASALMLRATANKQRLSRLSAVIVILALFYGTAVRHNGLFALPPLCYWLVRAYWPQPIHWLKSCLLALTAMAALMGATQWFNKQVVTEEIYAPQQFMIISLSMVSRATNENLMPQYLLYDHGLTYEEYHDRIGKSYDFMDTFLYHTEDPEKLRALKTAFISMLVKHPFIFLQERFAALPNLLRIGQHPYWAYQYPDSAHSKTTHWIFNYIMYQETSFWFLPWVWYILSIFLGFAGLRRIFQRKPYGMELLLLNVSGVMYITLTALVTPASDFRFNYWMVLACFCSIVLWGSTITRDEVATSITKCKNIALKYRTWRMQ